jgi:undecaprenyl-diphosphatase
MDYLRAAILGIVQGLAEFLPISSSGHLILVPALFKWPDQGLAFDVGLHLGTLLVLLGYFWRDWWSMGTSALRDLGRHSVRFREHSQQSRLLWLIALGSVPAGVTGLLFDDWIEDNLRQPWLVALALAGFGLVMLVADRRSQLTRGVDSIGVADGVLIGLAQAMALFPGISRSGATMSMGLFRHMTREAAARFAFLLGTPAFVGAAILKSGDLAGLSGDEAGELAVGFLFSACTGLVVVHYLLRFLRTRTLMPFIWYRFGAAALTLLIGAVRVS